MAQGIINNQLKKNFDKFHHQTVSFEDFFQIL
jgi:hypothetical protein